MAYQGEPQSTRQRMRPWLENRINSGEIAGLAWIDKTQLIFKVPWKHVGNREWKEDDSQIFKVTFFIMRGKYLPVSIQLSPRLSDGVPRRAAVHETKDAPLAREPHQQWRDCRPRVDR